MRKLQWACVLALVILGIAAACDGEEPVEPTGPTTAEILENDMDSIRDYLSVNLDSFRNVHNMPDLNFVEDTSGVFIAIYEEGVGAMPDSNDLCYTYYQGTFLNRVEFDNNLTSQPFQFRKDRNQVIDGWDIGIGYFNKGARGYLIVPSPLGYGAAANGAVPANSILVFNIELVDIR